MGQRPACLQLELHLLLFPRLDLALSQKDEAGEDLSCVGGTTVLCDTLESNGGVMTMGVKDDTEDFLGTVTDLDERDVTDADVVLDVDVGGGGHCHAPPS